MDILWLVVVTLIFIAIYKIWKEVSSIYVQPDFERPYFYILQSLVIKTSGFLARLGVKFGYGTEISNFRKALKHLRVSSKAKPTDVKIENVEITGITVRVYSPAQINTNDRPLLIYIHGGGYAFGSVEAYDSYLIRLVEEFNMTVTSILYNKAPEYPFPIPTNQCYSVTCHVLDNINEFKCNPQKVLIAGDSAGGNATAVTVQRLKKKTNLFNQKLQILIYPRTQMFNLHLPSYYYRNKDHISNARISFNKFIPWYLGLEYTNEIEEIFSKNYHMYLIEEERMKKIKGYYDIKNIDDKYKKGRVYYENYEQKLKNIFPGENEKLSNDNLLKRDEKMVGLFKNLATPAMSPLLADEQDLNGLPQTYFIVLEWDSVKDEGLLYAKRLENAGVKVNVAFYDKGFHGISNLIEIYQISRKIQNDLIDYLKINL